ncbi:MAG: saccharopine dehydrogenase family protein [Actinomycetota bacterium]
MRALVLGATGTLGRRASGELARSEDVAGLVLSARDHGRVARLASMLGGDDGRVRPAVVDVTDASQVAAAAGQVDVVVNCAGPAYELEFQAASAVVDAGTPYVSLCDDAEPVDRLRSLDERARSAGVTVVPGCGLSPGITNFLVALAAEEIDEVTEIDIAVASSSMDASGPAAELHFLYSFTRPAIAVVDHERVLEPSPGTPRLVYFPEPVGWGETFGCSHPEPITLEADWPGLRTLRFRMGLTERAVMDATRALVASRLAGTHRGRHRLLRLSRPAKPLLQSLPPRGPSWSAARVDVRGTQDNRHTAVSLGVVDHLQNLAPLPLALAAVELGTGRTVQPGVHAPEQVFAVKPLLRELTRRGIRIGRLQSDLV